MVRKINVWYYVKDHLFVFLKLISTRKYVFLKLISTRLNLHHSNNGSSFHLKLDIKTWISIFASLKSSTKRFDRSSMMKGKLFMNIRKNNGPKTEPCGTPLWIISSLYCCYIPNFYNLRWIFKIINLFDLSSIMKKFF